jgi:hypothetical protein
MLNRSNCSAPSASRRLGAAASVFAGLVPAIGFAASVSFQTPTTFTDTSVLDAPLSLSGFADVTLVQAQNFGDSAIKTVSTPASQTIIFANAPESGSAPSGTSSGVFYGGSEWNAGLFAGGTGSIQFDDVLRGQSWATSQPSNRQTVRIGGLTIGQTYIFQMFFSDQRSGNGGRTQFLSDAVGGGNLSDEFSTASAISVIGSFSASGITQDIFIFPGLTTSAPNDTTVAAFTLYSATAIPEPASFTGIAGVLALAAVGLRRSRR